MSTREAKLRITADGRAAEGTLSRLTKGAQSFGSGLTQAISPMWQGMGAISGLGAGAGLVALTNQAIQTRAQFSKLQFSIRAGSGTLVDMTRLQDMARASSDRWGYGMSKLSTTMQTLHDGSGDLEFVRDTLDAVSMASRASGQDLNDMASLAGDLGEKFGVSAVEMEDALATVLSMSNQGGLTFQDMSGAIGKLGASAKAAGLDGEQGLKRILGFANFASDALGSTEQAVEATNKLVAGMSTKDFQQKAMGLGVNVKADLAKGKGFEDVLVDLVSKNKGEKLTQTFGAGPEGKLLVALSDVVRDAGGGEAGRAKLKASFEQLSRSAMNAGSLAEAAAKKMGEPGSKFEAAMSDLEKAFQSDEVAEAISKFAAAIGPATKALLTFGKITFGDVDDITGGGGIWDKVNNPITGASKMWEELFPKVVDAQGKAPEVATAIQAYKPNQKNALFGSFENPLDAFEYEWKSRTGFGEKKEAGVWEYTDKDGRRQVETIRDSERAIAFGGDRFGLSSRDHGFARTLKRQAQLAQLVENGEKATPEGRGLNWRGRGLTLEGRGLNEAGKRAFMEGRLGQSRASNEQKQDSTKALHDLIRAQLNSDKPQRISAIENRVTVEVVNWPEYIPSGT